MALLGPENRVATTTTKILVNSMIVMIFCASSAIRGQAQDVQQNSTDESWTATTETSVDNPNPSRTMESHTKSGDRSVDKQRVEVLGPNGMYQPSFEIEKEIVQVDGTMTRTVERTYWWDVNGQMNLVQVTEEVARRSANGNSQVLRTTSNSDGDGHFRIMQRVVADTTKKSPNSQETKTTVYLPDGNGRLTPNTQTEELRTRTDDHTVEVKQTKFRQVSSGGKWEVGQVTESTIKEDGKNRTSEERVWRSDLDGKSSEISRTVSKETETAAGEKNSTVEIYSTAVPGLSPDGKLHLNQRVTTVQKKDRAGKITEEQVEQPKAGDPNGGQQVIRKTKYIVQYADSGTRQTKTIQERDINGNLNVVSVETRKSDPVPAAQGQKAPPDKHP
jgi:hypothetical protein